MYLTFICSYYTMTLRLSKGKFEKYIRCCVRLNIRLYQMNLHFSKMNTKLPMNQYWSNNICARQLTSLYNYVYFLWYIY